MSGLQRNTVLRIVLGVVLIVLLCSMGALVDRALHPEIPFFDEEHLIQAGVMLVTMVVLLTLLETCLRHRERLEDTLRASEARLRDITLSTADWAPSSACIPPGSLRDTASAWPWCTG